MRHDIGHTGKLHTGITSRFALVQVVYSPPYSIPHGADLRVDLSILLLRRWRMTVIYVISPYLNYIITAFFLTSTCDLVVGMS